MSSFVWCGKRDLNPYVKDTRPSNVPVCLFQHCRTSKCPPFWTDSFVIIANKQWVVKQKLREGAPELFCPKQAFVKICLFINKG